MTPFRIPEVKLSGTPRQRGRIHGESLRAEIQDLVRAWDESVRLAVWCDPRSWLEELLNETGFLAAGVRWTPELVEEAAGIAEGSNVDERTMLAFQFGDEVDWWLADRRHTRGACGDRCSTLGSIGNYQSPTLLGQTLDASAIMQGHIVVLRVRPDGSSLETLVISVAGSVGAFGVNNRSLGLCLNSLMLDLNHSVAGLPLTFVARGILARETMEDAVAFVRSVRHATGQSYTIADPRRIASLECSANKVAAVVPPADVAAFCRTNHPLSNDDVRHTPETMATMPAEEREQLRQHQINSETRLRSLESQLARAAHPISVAAAKAILRSHESPEQPICRHPDPDAPDSVMSLAAWVMELSASPVVHIAEGPPCGSEFGTFRL